MLHRVLSTGITAVVTSLVMSSCTTTVDGNPVPAEVSSEHPGGDPTTAKTPRPADRDPQAVTVALRKLDACGILDVNAARAAGNPDATLLPMGPHSCLLSPSAKYEPIHHGVEVMVGDGSNTFFQYHGAPVTIGGAKAYEYRNYSSSSKRCQLAFPVSFTRAIMFEYDVFDDTDTCQVVRQVAEAAVAKLQNPDAITVDAAKRPFAAWDGCFLLAQLLGQDAQNYTYQPAGVRDPFSGCKTTRKRGENSTSSPNQASSPELEISYDQAPTTPKQGKQLGDKIAEVRSYPSSCALIWNQGDSGTGNKWFAALVVKLTAANCDTAAQLAEKAVQLAGQAPSDASAQPQRPLLYKPDENDNPGAGACADFGVTGGQADCEPYHQVSVPQGTEKIMAAADADRNVQCAVFVDTVKALFGPSFNALTWGEHCFFVEPTHTLLIQVNVDPGNAPSEYGKNPDLWIERKETQIGGKPAITFWDKHKKDFDIYLSPYNDLTRNGNLHIQVEALQGRGDGARKDIKLDPAKAETAIQVITQVTQKYFAG